jgi:hypothetical protein
VSFEIETPPGGFPSDGLIMSGMQSAAGPQPFTLDESEEAIGISSWHWAAFVAGRGADTAVFEDIDNAVPQFIKNRLASWGETNNVTLIIGSFEGNVNTESNFEHWYYFHAFYPPEQKRFTTKLLFQNGRYSLSFPPTDNYIAYRYVDLQPDDPVYGDIVIDKNEYAVIRGGWRDRNGVWYNENPLSNSLSSINITFNGVTEI